MPVSRRSLGRVRDAGESRRTVLIALVANALIAVAKLGGWPPERIGGHVRGGRAIFAIGFGGIELATDGGESDVFLDATPGRG